MTVSKAASVDPDDPEVKKSNCFLTDQNLKQILSTMLERLQYFSTWHRARRAVALCLRLKTKLQQRAVKKPKLTLLKSQVHALYNPPTVSELQRAEEEICKLAQSASFPEDIDKLKACGAFGVPTNKGEISKRHIALKTGSRLCKLDPFLDPTGLLRVGGRLQKSEMPSAQKHPIVMPKKGHITELLVRHFHQTCYHQGRGITTNVIRQNGFWIVGCSSVVSSQLSKCVICRRLRAAANGQKMAHLPTDRLEPSPPFSYCAVDYFGPFFIKEGRKELKRYGVLFTCLSCRAVHVETANSLETDSFISALRRFIAIRGPLRQLRSDRGTNFVGAERELGQALNELDVEGVQRFLAEQNCDFFPFKMNPPSASHQGGVWERQIRSVRNVLAYLLHANGSQLDDESLRTFLHEAAAVVNCRPLTVECLNDPLSVTPLSPNQLLTLKSKVVLPPPGTFQREDLYSRKRWRRTQYLVNQFWFRWKTEFLQNLQVRTKWFTPKRNMQFGDVVIVKGENEPRNQWKLGRLVERSVGDDGLVRKVKVAIADPHIDSKGKRRRPLVQLERPVQKVILLHETEEISDEEPVS